MGVFSFLFRRPVLVNDEVFGMLERKPYGKHNTEFYFHSYTLPFTPTGYEIECEIKGIPTAESQAPTEAQRTFFKQIESHYDQLIGLLIPILKDELAEWKPPFDFSNFEKEFRLVYLHIPALDSYPVMWDWSFEINRNNMYLLSVSMQGDVPQPGIGISY